MTDAEKWAKIRDMWLNQETDWDFDSRDLMVELLANDDNTPARG